jgi:hypothetical protein
VSAGALSVQGVGSPGALPAPAGESGVTSGDGQFTNVKPLRWPASLPPDALSAELLWLGGTKAAQLGVDGLLRVTDDGRAWQVVRWLPWSAAASDAAEKPGSGWWVELPDGDRSPPLAAEWTDNRAPGGARLYLAHREAGGAWVVDADTPQGILTGAGERLAYNHVVRFAAGRWVLLTGCVSRSEGSALALRELRDGKLGEPRVVPLAMHGEEPKP